MTWLNEETMSPRFYTQASHPLEDIHQLFDGTMSQEIEIYGTWRHRADLPAANRRVAVPDRPRKDRRRRTAQNEGNEPHEDRAHRELRAPHQVTKTSRRVPRAPASGRKSELKQQGTRNTGQGPKEHTANNKEINRHRQEKSPLTRCELGSDI